MGWVTSVVWPKIKNMVGGLLSAIKTHPWKAVAAALLVFGGWQYLRAENIKDDAFEASLAYQNAIAEADSTRLVAEKEVRILRDSAQMARVWERRAIQARDSLEEAEQARSRLAITIDSLRARDQSPDSITTVGDTSDVHFSVREIPYSANVKFTVAPEPHYTRMDLTVSLDPIPLRIENRCRDGQFANEAVTRVAGPDWATLDITETVQGPRICNPQATITETTTLPYPVMAGGGAVIGGTAAFFADGRVGEGVGIGFLGGTALWGAQKLIGLF